MFKIGQKVVCVDDSANLWVTANGFGYAKHASLDKGKIYTVTGFGRLWCGDPGLFLSETNQGKWPFCIKRFRPLVTRKGQKDARATVDRHFRHHLEQPARVV